MLLISLIGWAIGVLLVKKAVGVSHYQLNFQLGWLMIMISGLFYSNTEVK